MDMLPAGQHAFRDVARPHVATVRHTPRPFVGQHNRRPPRQHLCKRNDRPTRKVVVPFCLVERQRVGEREISAACPPQRRKMGARAEPLTKVVRQRPDVEPGGAVDAQRQAVAIQADEVETMDGDAHRVG